MTEYSRFFDGTTYTEAQFSEFMSRIMKNDGILIQGGNLAVSQSTPAAMSVSVAAGEAWVQGAWYQNTAAKTMSISASDATHARIDRIILRLSWASNSIILAVLEGTPATPAVTPTLTQSAATWEISLATILVTNAATSIVSTAIEDDRTSTDCGYAACNLGAIHIEDDGSMDLVGVQIHSLSNPTSAQDAATMAYADTKAGLASPTFTGTPTAPMQTTGNDSTRLATTAFVQQELGTWGAWTPSLAWTGSAGSSISGIARYLKIGKIVFFQYRLSYAASSTTTGLVITGLPGTLATSNDKVPLTAIKQYYSSGYLYGNPMAYIDTSAGGSVNFLSFLPTVGVSANTNIFMIEGFYEVS